MVNESVVRNAVGIIGNVISLGLFLSPAPTFYGIIKKKAVEDVKPGPYLATLLNCAFWVFYGMPFVHPNSTLVLSVNSVGILFEAVYLTIFLSMTTKMNGSSIVGMKCDIKMLMIYVSHLTIMAKVIKTKSVKYMPFWLSLTNFLNGLCWTTYALISNGIGAIFGAVQLILYAYYWCRGENQIDDDKVISRK